MTGEQRHIAAPETADGTLAGHPPLPPDGSQCVTTPGTGPLRASAPGIVAPESVKGPARAPSKKLRPDLRARAPTGNHPNGGLTRHARARKRGPGKGTAASGRSSLCFSSAGSRPPARLSPARYRWLNDIPPGTCSSGHERRRRTGRGIP